MPDSKDMGYHPRIETNEYSNLLTSRTRSSRLWFINNPALENAMLGYAAKFADRYNVTLYALAIEGNHLHTLAHFPDENRAHFMRDLNSSIARAVPKHVPSFDSGNLWARRYSNEFLPDPADVERYFFYTVLQPVKDGLEQRISQYPGYNCFHDAVHGIARKFEVTDWAKFNAARRRNPKVKEKDFRYVVTLKYARLPGYEHLSQKEYATLMHKKLEEHRLAIVQDRLDKGLGFLGRENLLRAAAGSLPRNTKTSTRQSHRPRILCHTLERKLEVSAWYFALIAEYRTASARYRCGELGVTFPPGMYRPYIRWDP